MKTIQVPGCPGTTVRKLPSAHGLQFLEVTIVPGGKIPLHTHECAATMIVTRGSARKLAKNSNGVRVNPGSVVVKKSREPHGFADVGEEGFQFISLSNNDGIVRDDGNLDMEFV